MKGIEDVILEVAREMKSTKTEAEAYTRAVFKAVKKFILEGEKIRTPIGTFKVKEWKERVVRNKITGGKPVFIPRRKVVVFTPNERLKKLLNGEQNDA